MVTDKPKMLYKYYLFVVVGTYHTYSVQNNVLGILKVTQKKLEAI